MAETERRRLTDGYIKKLKPPATGRFEVRDEDHPALVLRVSANGSKSWSVTYRSRTAAAMRRFTLGSWQKVKVKLARQQAKAISARAALGGDPVAELKTERQRLRSQTAFRDVAADWLKTEKSKWRTSTRATYRRAVDRLKARLGALPLVEIGRQPASAALEAIREETGVGAARTARIVLRSIIGFAVDRGLLEHIPALPRLRNSANARTRVLTMEELQRVWNSAPTMAGHLGHIVRILMLTGQRRNEVAGMRWAELSEDAGVLWWVIPAARNKGRHEHRVPLVGEAAEIVKRRSEDEHRHPVFVFPAKHRKGPVPVYMKAVRKLWEASEIADARLHDLRRTTASRVAEKYGHEAASAVLGHARSSVTAVHYANDPRVLDPIKGEALRWWDAEVLRAVAEKKPATGAA